MPQSHTFILGKCSSTELELRILGPPVPVQRPRLSRRSRVGHSHVYSPSAGALESARQKLRSLVGGQNAAVPVLPAGSEVMVEVRFHLQRRHGRYPDLDNLLKFVLDVGNGIIYRDDSCVHKIAASKEILPRSGSNEQSEKGYTVLIVKVV